MNPRIVFVTAFPDAADTARAMAPAGFDLIVAPGHGAAFRDAMAGT